MILAINLYSHDIICMLVQICERIWEKQPYGAKVCKYVSSYFMIFVTVFRKTNRSARKSIIAYARKYAFAHEDANVNKEKEARFTPRLSVGLASSLDGGVFARLKSQQSNKKEICFSR